MKRVSVSAASALAKEAWIDVAVGTDTALRSVLGEPEVDEFLPGLGDLSARAFVDDAGRGYASGVIYTGSIPNPTGVSIMAPARCARGLIALDALAMLHDLPRGALGPSR